MNMAYEQPNLVGEDGYVISQPPTSTSNSFNQLDSANGAKIRTNDFAPLMSKGSSDKTWPKKWKLFAVAAFLFQVILIITVVLIAVKVHQPATTNHAEAREPSQAENMHVNYPTTCLNLTGHGEMKSGFYIIQPDRNATPFRTYCDMESSGGGWTLIASVHENDINGKCTTADNWMSNDNEYTNGLISRNWENENTFGNAKQSTSSDYKNSGYYSIKATDVMIRHAPNDVELENSKQNAVLEYHTENGFLSEHGGNLYGIYHEEFNLQSKSLGEIYFTKNNKEMLDALEANADDIISGIPDFYHYEYDSSSSSLLNYNGSSNIFSNYGMQVYAYPCRTLTYGTNYTCSSYYTDVHIASRNSTPFFALMTIGNNNIDRKRYSFYFRVYSQRPSSDIKQSYSGTLREGNFTMNYNAHCRYNQSTPSIPSLCDVFYAVSNVQLWKSSSFTFRLRSLTSYSSFYYVYQYVESYPQNVVLGYTMFSRENGTLIPYFSVVSALRKMLTIFTSFSSVAETSSELEPGVVVPVKYTIGGPSVLGTIPISLREDVEVGYMQFLARNSDGAALAFCPAVRVHTWRVENLCVGGVFKIGSNTRYCSDYANWNYGSTFSNLNEFSAGLYSRSRHFIQSTILIFYR